MSHLPYRLFIVSAWLFVLAITVVDIRWAIHYSETIKIWEINPIMLWVVNAYGVWIASAARLGTVAFGAILMPVASRRSQIFATLTCVSVHLYLAATYAMIIWGHDEGMD